MISEEIYTLIGSESFIMVNKKLLRAFKGSADSAVLLIELVNIHKMMANKLQVDDFGYFKISQNWITKVLGMSTGKQKTNLTNLIKMGLVNTIIKGYPASRHISLNMVNIKELLMSDETTKEDIQRQEFYETINEFLNTSSTKRIISEKRVFGNMKEGLVNTIKYISLYIKMNRPTETIEWNSKMVGITRNFVYSKSIGKPFDYAFVKDILIKIPAKHKLREIPDDLIVYGRRVVDKSPADQLVNFETDIKELLKW